MRHEPGPVTTLAPAKLNLGLEIIGKRPDGYHEIRSVMTTIGLADRLTFTPAGDRDTVRIDGVPDVALRHNLIFRAIEAFIARTGIRGSYHVTVEKHIPSPGGLGGASSDGAATLRALNAMHGEPLDPRVLLGIGATLGSDVPFFLGPSPALASSTGTDLTPLPPIRGYAVLVVPRLGLMAKTATLYTALAPSDFSDGSRAGRVAASIAHGDLPGPADLANAFVRPLYALAPDLPATADAMLDSGAPSAALSGAGPAHFVLFRDRAAAHALAARLHTTMSRDTLVTVTPLGSAPDTAT